MGVATYDTNGINNIKIVNRDGVAFYYDKAGKRVLDAKGNSITISEELDGVKRQNLAIYLTDLFGDFYQIQARFDRDCMYDKQEDILWE